MSRTTRMDLMPHRLCTRKACHECATRRHNGRLCRNPFLWDLLDAGMPIDQVQKFLRHKHLSTTQIYAETSLKNLGEHYLRALS